MPSTLSGVHELHTESRGTYGSPRVLAALRSEGRHVGKTRVERAMRGLGLCGRMPRRWRMTTRPNPKHAVESNRLARDFTAERPDQRWVTLRAAVFEFIEVFYNRQRLHSSLGYKTPAQVEDEFARAA